MKKAAKLLMYLLSSMIVVCGCSKDDKVPEDTKSVEYREDFYDSVNHKLLAETKIPVDEGIFTQFSDLGNTIYENLNNILKTTVEQRKAYEVGSSEQKIADLYVNALDYEARDTAGLGEYKQLYDSIHSSKSISEYLATISNIAKTYGQYSLISLSPDVNMKDSAQYAAYFSEPDLILGKEILEDKDSESLWVSYKKYVKNIFVLLGEDEKLAEAKAQELFDFQKDLAMSCLSPQDNQDPSQIYNPYTKVELSSLLTNLDISTLLNDMAEGDWEHYIVTNPEVFKKINTYLTEEHLELLKDYSTLIIMHDNGKYLTKEFQDNYIEFSNLKNGVKEKYSDEKQASKTVQELLEWDFGKIYVEKYFSKADKEEVEAMINEIIAAYEKRIDQLDWMSDETKNAAKIKLHTIKVKVGYPDEWPDYTNQFRVLSSEQGGVLANNQLSIQQTTQAYLREMARQPVDKAQWLMTPQTVNAYYNPQNNEIVFPAAVLQQPFYNKKGTYAQNLGGIGMVIAHEITHAFDNNGAQYDEEGNVSNWWTQKDYENFEQLSQQVVRYYGGFEAFDGRFVDGQMTVAENIADLGALNCVTSIVGNDKKNLQELFEQYALIWAVKMTDERALFMVNTDVHSPGKVRTNAGVSATDAFYTAYDVVAGDKMYIAPDERPKIW